MKKSVWAFCSRLRVYWIQLPLILVLSLCIFYNENSKAVFKLYPLIVTCIIAIIFVFIFFFRMIKVSYSEIRYVGWFSRRTRATIVKDKSIVIERINRFRLIISLVGNDDTLAGLDWLKNDKRRPREINQFRGKSIGGKRTVKRFLKFFGVSKEDFDTIISSDENFKKDYEFVTVSTDLNEDEDKRIRIHINETI